MKAELVGIAVGLIVLTPLIGAPCAFTAAVCVFAFTRIFTYIATGRWFQ